MIFCDDNNVYLIFLIVFCLLIFYITTSNEKYYKQNKYIFRKLYCFHFFKEIWYN